MTVGPFVAHHWPNPPPHLLSRVEPLAAALSSELPALSVSEEFRSLVVDRLVDAPTLELDDLSEIPLLDRAYDVRFLQDRARLRAGSGDFVASCFPPVSGYEPYCRDVLGLGAPRWLHPQPPKNSLCVASACWEDRAVRRMLIQALRSGELVYIQPHMGIREVWSLAALLHRSSRRPVKVVAPPPGLCSVVNDKIAFTDIVRRLLGSQAAPRTAVASNFATLSKQVRVVARSCERIGIRVPNSAGGCGTVVTDAARFRGTSLASVRRELQELLSDVWNGECRLQVAGWESAVLCSPSVQLWIPPGAHGEPLVEGVFQQVLLGSEEAFVGSRPAQLPEHVLEELVNGSWLLGSLFQRLGYVGRCSFDTLIVGSSLEHYRAQFVECNGRWGGTSIPMTLMNRLFGDWGSQPCATRECAVEGLGRLTLDDLLHHFNADLFSARGGSGQVIFYNPGRMQSHSAIDVLGLGSTLEDADRLVSESMPRRVQELIAGRGSCCPSGREPISIRS